MTDIQTFAHTHETSTEIVCAIFDLAAEGEARERLWADPTPAERLAVERLAWTYADPQDDELYWGREKVAR